MQNTRENDKQRLVWYLVSNTLITKFQSGFPAERSTNDNLVRLETFIRDAFIKREQEVAVFFDLEKSNDTTCPFGLGGAVGCASDWKPGGRGFDPSRGRQHSFVEIDHDSSFSPFC